MKRTIWAVQFYKQLRFYNCWFVWNGILQENPTGILHMEFKKIKVTAIKP